MIDVWLLIHDHPAWVWMAVTTVFLAAELLTGSGWLLWPAGAAGATAAVVALVHFNPTEQALLFAVLTILFTYAGRRWIRARLGAQSSDLNDVSARLIGQVAEAASAFHAGVGRVSIDGKEWPAEIEGGGPAERGSRLEVIALLGGSRLRVRPIP